MKKPNNSSSWSKLKTLIFFVFVLLTCGRLYADAYTDWVDAYATWLKANPPPGANIPPPISTPTPSPTATPSPTPAGKFRVGDKVMPTTTVNVRETPGGALVGTQGQGVQGTIQDGPQGAILNGTNITWWKVAFADPPSGWTGEDNLVPHAAPAPTPTPAAATHYVSPTGNDSNAGTSPNQSWKTLGKAIASAPLGATVSIAAGTYAESPNFNRGASAASPITFRGEGTVIVTGPVNLSGQYNTVSGLKTGMTTLQSSGSNPPCFLLSGSNDTLANCVAEGLTLSPITSDEGVCITLRGDHNTALKCTVSNTDNVDAFRIFGDSNVIDGATVFNHANSQYSAGPHADYVQTWGGLTNSIIQNCLFYGSQGTKQFGVLATEPGGNTSNVTNNVWRNTIVVGGEHLFLTLANMKVYNSVWYKSAKSIGDLLFFDQGRYSGYVLRNSAWYGCGTNKGNGFIQGNSLNNVACDHNFFAWVDNSGVTHVTGSNAVNGGDPMFVNPDGRDFHTKPGSPLRGAGVAISPGFPDRDGNPRPSSGSWDIGAYQAQ